MTATNNLLALAAKYLRDIWLPNESPGRLVALLEQVRNDALEEAGLTIDALSETDPAERAVLQLVAYRVRGLKRGGK